LTPEQVLKKAYASHEKVTISFSGAKDVILIDMASFFCEQLFVFSLDTGRLHAETYRFIEDIRNHYGIEIDILSPDNNLLNDFVKEKG